MMPINTNAGSSLIFYTGKNEAGNLQKVLHGEAGELAASSASWTYQSVAMSAMQAFINSAVNPGDASYVYLGHREDIIPVTQNDLTLLYPSSDQFPLNYLGIDPMQVAVVWLDVDAAQAAPNAVAAFSQVGMSTTTITTLALPGNPGALGFVGKSAGSSVVATCQYGEYNPSNGTINWTGSGSLLLQGNGGAVTVTDLGGFPDGWIFSAPQLQPDGSWVVTLEGGIPASDTISSVTANPTSIVDDGVSSSTVTATVVNGSGQPISGVTVNWTTTLGTLSVPSSVTGSDGTASTQLTDNGAPGTATVTATITGDSKFADVIVSESTAGYVISSLTSDKDSIASDGVDAARLTATVKDQSGNVATGVAVYWATSLGNLNHPEQDTDSAGQSNAKLTDSGDTGKAVVTASLDNGNQFAYTIALTEAVPLNLYCSTGAPLNTGMLAAVQPTNKIALYGTPGKAVQLNVTGSARFISGNAQSLSVTLDASGYALADVVDTQAESVTVSATTSGETLTGTMAFMAASDKGAIYVNSQTPADNKTPNTLYWWDYQGAGVSRVQVSLSGNMHFSDNTQEGLFPLNAPGGAVAIDIFDATAEIAAATLAPDSPYYVPSAENISFLTYQP
ncbi:Ig-like domain-containing protein [Cronobacter sakazakii]